jgi:hypothetical protein
MKGFGFANGCANNRKHKGEDGLTVPTVAVAAGAVAHTELAVEPPHHHVLAFELGLGAHCFLIKRSDETSARSGGESGESEGGIEWRKSVNSSVSAGLLLSSARNTFLTCTYPLSCISGGRALTVTRGRSSPPPSRSPPSRQLRHRRTRTVLTHSARVWVTVKRWMSEER